MRDPREQLLESIPGEKAAMELLHRSTLLPCPFCGEAPQFGRFDPGAPYPGGYYYVTCLNENCPVNISIRCDKKAYSENAADAFQEVISRWNTRAPVRPAAQSPPAPAP